jgi:hypothetical protein
MDERRFEELKEKRRVKGLTDDEADELGRMFAEEAGKPYSNARHGMQEPEAAPDPSLPEGTRITGN